MACYIWQLTISTKYGTYYLSIVYSILKIGKSENSLFEWIFFQSCFVKKSYKRSRDRKSAIVKFRDRDHLTIFLSCEDRRSPRDRETKIATQIVDRAIGDRSCLGNNNNSNNNNLIQPKTALFKASSLKIHIQIYVLQYTTP